MEKTEKWSAVANKVEEEEREKQKTLEQKKRKIAEPILWLVDFLESEEGEAAMNVLRAAGLLNKLRDFPSGDRIKTAIGLHSRTDGGCVTLCSEGIFYYKRIYSGPIESFEGARIPQYSHCILPPLDAAVLLEQEKVYYSLGKLRAEVDEVANEISRHLAK